MPKESPLTTVSVMFWMICAEPSVRLILVTRVVITVSACMSLESSISELNSKNSQITAMPMENSTPNRAESSGGVFWCLFSTTARYAPTTANTVPAIVCSRSSNQVVM